jgi:hypothetical protein
MRGFAGHLSLFDACTVVDTSNIVMIGRSGGPGFKAVLMLKTELTHEVT